MPIAFRKVSDFNRGLILDLLTAGYSFDTRYQQQFGADWQDFDDFFFDNLQIADKYGFITTYNDEAIGLVSWDPRNAPAYVEIGHNCIIPKYKNNGYGKRQLQEAFKRIHQTPVQKILVTTNIDLVPAQRMYESLGFKLHQTRKVEGFFKENLDYVYVPDSVHHT